MVRRPAVRCGSAPMRHQAPQPVEVAGAHGHGEQAFAWPKAKGPTERTASQSLPCDRPALSQTGHTCAGAWAQKATDKV
eukprot:2276284-Heterocapsa_arctica.AAC.1